MCHCPCISQAEGQQLVIIPEVRRLVAECVPSRQLRERFEALTNGKAEEEEEDRPEWIAQAQEKSRQIAQHPELADAITSAPKDSPLAGAVPGGGSRLYLWLSCGSGLLSLLLFLLGWRLGITGTDYVIHLTNG